MSDFDFLFIGGCPRSGNSLLSTLIGNLGHVGVVQDLTDLHQLKRSALYVMQVANGVQPELADRNSYVHMSKIDLRLTEFFPAFMQASLDDCLNWNTETNGKILRHFLARMDTFLFREFNVPDPRKDRRQGSFYLKDLDIKKLLGCGSMSEVFRCLMADSATALHQADNYGSKFSIICEKTPENNANIDVLSLVSQKTGFRFLHLVRDPVSVYGARRQRIKNASLEEFLNFFSSFSEPSQSLDDALSSSSLRFEDMIDKPEAEIRRVVSELKLSHQINVTDGQFSSLNPGKYQKYVGCAIDKSRNSSNFENVSPDEAKIIYNRLAPFCEKYSYGPYS